MTENILLFVLIPAALGVLALMWFLIGFSLVYRKYQGKKRALIENTFADVLSRHLYGESNEDFTFIQIQRIFRRIGITESSPENVQFLIDLMIRTQRSVLGRNYARIKLLYDQIPPYKASYKKTKSKHWHIKARGIREIYEMDQAQYVNYIAKFRNDPNIFIRREAQIALVVFLGWESLRFLPYLTHRLELWQQIKIVEKLHDLYPVPKLEYLRETHNIKSNDGRELVMRIIRKYRLESELDYIISQLTSDSFDLRETAINCLTPFKLNEDQLGKVKELFPELQSFQQQKQVLALIDKSSEEDDVPYYLELLQQVHDMLKLRVAEILWTKGYEAEVRQFYLDQYSLKPGLVASEKDLTEA